MEEIVDTVCFERYPAYKYTSVERLGEIPEHWDVIKAKYLWKEIVDLSSNENETLLSVSQYTGVGISGDRSRGESLVGLKKVKKNDLVINIMLAWLGGLGLSSFEGIVSTAYAVYRLTKEANQKYLHYLYRTNVYLDEFATRSKGIVPSRWRMYTEDFGQVLTLYPPLTEQTAIAKFLDKKTAQIDLTIAKKEKQIALLKERRQVLIHKAVTCGLNECVTMKDSGANWIGEVPQHWMIKRIKYVASQVSIKVLSKSNPLNYIGMENIESWTGEYLKSESETEGLASSFKKGDILFGKLRPYLAKVYLAQEEGICSTEFLIFRNGLEIDNRFLYQLMLSFEFINLIESSTYGSKMPRASGEFIGNQLIAIPPKSEQIEICEYIKIITSKITNVISCTKREIEKLKEYRATLINSAVTGKIKVS